MRGWIERHGCRAWNPDDHCGDSPAGRPKPLARWLPATGGSLSGSGLPIDPLFAAAVCRSALARPGSGRREPLSVWALGRHAGCARKV